MKLREDSVDWSLRHIEKFGDTNILPVPFEYAAIRHSWSTVIKPWLLDQNLLSWVPRDARRCLAPKIPYGFRIITQLDPLEAIVYTALIYELGKTIESRRISKERRIVFSNRFLPKPTGELWDPEFDWTAFIHHSSQIVENNPTFSAVVRTDIADFYSRIYYHRIEEELNSWKCQTEHVNALLHLLKSWRFGESFGVPIGPSASHLVAEVALIDIDGSLLNRQANYCRCVDDFRIFCADRIDAHEKWESLAHALYANGGLALQQYKTRILSREEFRGELPYFKTGPADPLRTDFRSLLDELGGRFLPYLNEQADLPEELQAGLDKLDLKAELTKIVNAEGPLDTDACETILKRLSEKQDASCVDLVLSHSKKFYSIFPRVTKYLSSLRGLLDEHIQIDISKKLESILIDTEIGHSEFNRVWAMTLFSDGPWCAGDALASLANRFTDDFSRRAIALAMGRAENHGWLREMKERVLGREVWERRAFLAAASRLPGNESTHYYGRIRRTFDPLEEATYRWASEGGFI